MPRPRAVRWADLRLRVLSAVVLVPLALVCLWLGGAAWGFLVILAGVGMAVEWTRLCALPPWRRAAIAVPAAVVLAAAAAFAAGSAGVWLLAAGAVVVRLLARAPVAGYGVWYVGLGAVALIWLRDDAAAGRANVLFVMLIVWASDIGAYVVGRLVGGPKLAPAISPGKTWSGAAGGVVAAALVGLGVASLVSIHLPIGHCVVISIAIGIASQIGDLLESGFKRHFGVKDSGRSIPGHGGLLDRLDGMLTAAPTAILIALLLGEGVWLWQ